MKISLFTKKTVYENTIIGDFPVPELEPKKCTCSGSGQKGRLQLRNTAEQTMDCSVNLLNLY